MALYDFRSDTVTRPTAAMLRAMADAPTGDDVFGEAPVADTICTGPLLLQSFALARIPKSARGNKTSGGSTATRNHIATQLLNA